MTSLDKDKNAAIANHETDLEWHRNMLERYRESVRSKNVKIKSLETEIGKLQSSYKLVKHQDISKGDNEVAMTSADYSSVEHDDELLYRSPTSLNSSTTRNIGYKNSLVLTDYRNTTYSSVGTDAEDDFLKVPNNSSNITPQPPQDLITCQQELAQTKQMCQNREQEIAGFQRIIVALQNESNTYRKKEHDNLLKQASLTRDIVLLNEKLRIQPFDEKRMFESEQKMAMLNSVIQKLESDILMMKQEETVHKDAITQLNARIVELESSIFNLQGEKDSMEHMLNQSRAVSALVFQELEDMKGKQGQLQEQLQLMTQQQHLHEQQQQLQEQQQQLQQEQHEQQQKQQQQEKDQLYLCLREAQNQVAHLETEVQRLSEKTKEEDLVMLIPVENNVIQLSTEESTALEDELILLRKENNILSYDITCLKNELDNLSKEKKDMTKVQDEINSLHEQLSMAQLKSQEHENDLQISQMKIHEMECEIAELHDTHMEIKNKSLEAQSQATKETIEGDDAVVVVVSAAAATTDGINEMPDLHSSRHSSKISKRMSDTPLVNKSLFDEYHDDDMDSRYGPLDEKDDVFFQHYTEIISDLKTKLESKDSEIQFMKGSLKNKDEAIISLKNSLNQVQEKRKTAEALSLMEIEEQSLASKKNEMALKTQTFEDMSNDIPCESVVVQASEDHIHLFTNTMYEGLTSLKDMARLVVSPYGDNGKNVTSETQENRKQESPSRISSHVQQKSSPKYS